MTVPLQHWRDEMRAALLYRVLAETEKGTSREALFADLARAAEAQGAIWAEAVSRGGTALPALEPGLRVCIAALLIRRFGPRRIDSTGVVPVPGGRPRAVPRGRARRPLALRRECGAQPVHGRSRALGRSSDAASRRRRGRSHVRHRATAGGGPERRAKRPGLSFPSHACARTPQPVLWDRGQGAPHPRRRRRIRTATATLRGVSLPATHPLAAGRSASDPDVRTVEGAIHELGHDPHHHLDPGAHRRPADLAAQPRVGLCTERDRRHDRRDLDHSLLVGPMAGLRSTAEPMPPQRPTDHRPRRAPGDEHGGQRPELASKEVPEGKPAASDDACRRRDTRVQVGGRSW